MKEQGLQRLNNSGANILPPAISQVGRLTLVAVVLLAVLALPVATLIAQTSAPAPAAKTGAGVTLNLQNVDIDAAARAMSQVLGRAVIVDPRVKGQVTIVTEGPVSRDKALAQFGSSLRAQGFAMVESSGLIKVLPEADAKLQGGNVTVGNAGEAAQQTRGDQVVTQVIKLNYENANNMVPILRPLIAPNNTINANPANNTLVITDYADNLRRIARIVAALDVPNGTDLEIIPMQHAVASDVAATLSRLLDAPGGGAAQGVPGAGTGGTILADARTNALLVRAVNPARMALIKQLIGKLDQPSAANNNLHVVYLRNAQADKLAEVLKNVLTGQSGTVGARNNAPLGGGGLGAPGSINTPAGNSATPQVNQPQQAFTGGSTGSGTGATGGAAIQADLASNALIITAPEPVYRQLRGIIDQLDARRAQVYIEALIAEVSNNRLDEFGVQWQAAAAGNNNTSGIYLGTNLPRSGASLLNLQGAAANRDAAAGTAAAAGALGDLRGLNFAIIKKIGSVITIPMLARALESGGGTNIISTPNILALDNEEAKFSSGQNVPFITGQFTNTGASAGSVNPFQTIERKDVGLQLRVRPQISEGGTIKLQLYLEVSSVAEGTAQGVITNKSSIENTIIVDDGQMIALGGLLKDGFTQSQDKVPLLGDVPIIGGLFRYEKRQRDKVNLMIFLRPVVLRDTNASSILLQDRYDYMRNVTNATQPESRIWSKLNESPTMPDIPPQAAPAPANPASAPVNPPKLLLSPSTR